MNVIILSVLTILSTSWAAEVRVYDYITTYKHYFEPIAVSPLPWRFYYNPTNQNYEFYTFIVIKNSSKSVTWNVTCTTDQSDLTVEYDKQLLGYTCFGPISNSTEIKISVNFYKSEVLCSSLLIAEGRAVSRGSTEEKTYERMCGDFCELEVDVSDVCDDPLLTTTSEKTIEVTTVEVNRAINNLTRYAPTSPRGIIETTASNITTNNTNATQTDNSDIVVIVPSVLGVLLVVVVVAIVVGKCRLFKRHPTGNPQLPTIQPHQSFYAVLPGLKSSGYGRLTEIKL